MRTQKFYFERFNSLNFLLRTTCHLEAKKGDERDAVTHFRGLNLPVLRRVWLFATPWTVAHQAPLSTGFSRQEHWSGLPFPPPGDLPDAGIEPTSLSSPALAGGSLLLGHLGSPPGNREGLTVEWWRHTQFQLIWFKRYEVAHARGLWKCKGRTFQL